MNLVLLEPNELDDQGHARIDGERALHLRKVLGVQIGSRVRVGLLNGAKGHATVIRIEDRIELDCDSFDELEVPVPLGLLLCMPRPKTMKRLWSPIAQLGVTRVFLSAAERVEKFYFDSHATDAGWIDKEFRQGLMQARRTFLPKVTVHRSLPHLLAGSLSEEFTGATRWLADLDERSDSSTRPLSRFASLDAKKPLVLAVGPEGGFVSHERELFKGFGFETFSLGPTPFRTDVALLASLALIESARH